ncbi:MAG: hypothetical protein OXD49_05480 [Candidatus Poribacteria bacterium]|nr:hypothetical protein [Candidatus Poribacteria bacterium]
MQNPLKIEFPTINDSWAIYHVLTFYNQAEERFRQRIYNMFKSSDTKNLSEFHKAYENRHAIAIHLFVKHREKQIKFETRDIVEKTFSEVNLWGAKITADTMEDYNKTIEKCLDVIADRIEEHWAKHLGVTLSPKKKHNLGEI